MAPSAPDRGPGPGCLVGAYVLDELLGKGGMGEVYRARDTRLDRTVAIKFVSAERALYAGAAERLANEARVNSALNHPGIVTVHDIGRFRGRPFIVMEYVDGQSLATRLMRGPLRVKDALELAAQIADALAAAHAAGVVHRDLKPQNIMVTSDGRAKIVDFGLGMMQRGPRPPVTSPGSPTETVRLPLEGTVGYMSPEQASGIVPDLRSDQFALGAILYEMVSGRQAFSRGTPVQTLSDIIDAEPVTLRRVCPTVPSAYAAIVVRCLQKDPRCRYGSTYDLAHDLRAAQVAVSRARTRPAMVLRNLSVRPWRGAILALAVLAIMTLSGFQRFDQRSLSQTVSAQAAPQGETYQLLVMRSMLARRQGQYEAAAAAAKRATELDPNGADAFRELGRAYEELDRLDDAEAAFGRSLEIRRTGLTGRGQPSVPTP